MSALEIEADESIDPQALSPSALASTEPLPTVPKPEETVHDDTEDTEFADQSVGLRLNFIDFAGYPIEGLGYKIMIDGKIAARGTTDDKGVCTPLSGLMPFSAFEILVEKEDGSYASKHVGEIQCGDMEICGVAPTVKVAFKTEEHKGSPALADAKPTPAALAPPPAQAPKPNAPPVGVVPAKQPKPSTQTQSCRNEAGHPVTSMMDKFQDWAGRNRIPTLGLWSWKDFQPGAKGCTTPHEQPNTNATAPSTPAAPPTANAAKGQDAGPLKVKSVNQAPPQEVDDLMTVMAEQVTWKWEALPPSATILASISNRTFSTPTDLKPSSKTVGRCYKSVKVGLWRAHLVQGVNEDIPAAGAGKWLSEQKFTDVTKEVPDGRWAMPGDVIVYKYSDAKEKELDTKSQEKYKKALEKYEQEKPKYLAAKQAYAEAKAAFDAEKTAWTKANPKNPFPRKFEKPAPKVPKAPELEDNKFGHIDVRTYDGYLSDFAGTRLPDSTKFVPIGIYRKTYDPLPDLRVRAFLKVLREWECHEEKDDAKRYFILQNKLNGKKYFSDTSTHPYANELDKAGSFSGAYQIRHGTWNEQVQKFGLPSDFSPLTQDRMAVSLIEVRGALGDVRKGNIEEAVNALGREWSSLPSGKDVRTEKRNGASYKLSITDLIERYNSFLAEIIK
jgi:muramidase (phage lysozyme)